MFANKNKIFAPILLSLVLVLTLSAALPVPAAHADDLGQDILGFMGCNDNNNDGLNIEDCVTSKDKGTVSSFIDFKGDLKAPNAEGYASGLTKVKDARTYILNITNFFLGFLGLISVVIIIYGGYMTVLAAGDAEKAKKGRAVITTTAIGLILIMGSFAIVNTLLLAPGGSDKGTTSESAINASTIRGVAGAQRFNYLAQQIDEIILKVYNSYQFHLRVKAQIETSLSNVQGFVAHNCVVPFSNCVNEFRNLVNGQLAPIQNFSSDSNANAKFKVGLNEYLNGKDGIINTLNAGLAGIAETISSLDCNTTNVPLELNPCTDGDFNQIREQINTLKDSTLAAKFQAVQFLKDSYREDMATSTVKTAEVYKAVKGLASESIGLEYFTAVLSAQGLQNPDQTLALGAFDAEAKNMESLMVIGQPLSGEFQNTIKILLKNLVQIKSVLQNLKFVDAIISADGVKGNAPFIVNFSSVGSKDPSGLGITNEQIEWDLNGDGKFNTFSGEDKEAGFMNCPEKAGATAYCIFSKAGTYRVTVKIKPNQTEKSAATDKLWSQEIAPGLSYIDILVNPPVTKINLDVGPKAGTPRPVIRYNDQTGTITEDHDKMYFTLSEARNGLKFDATKSTYSTGTSISNDPTAKVRWNFGVPSQNNDTYQVPAANTLTLEQAYPSMGSYPVRFEVMDKNGVVDRKIFTIVVSDLAPRISNPPAQGKIGEELTFDGSESTSDGGAIIFNWKVERTSSTQTLTSYLRPLKNSALNLAHAAEPVLLAALKNPAEVLSQQPQDMAKMSPVIPAKVFIPSKRSESNEYYSCNMPEGQDDTLKCKFKKAGDYRVTLSLDSQGTPIEESTVVVISSNEPTANFKAVKLNSAAPALYKLDAGSVSFDPDEKDNANLQYSWEISPATCVLVGFANTDAESDLIQASTSAFSAQLPCDKLKEFNLNSAQPVVKFTAVGSYTVNLVVRSADEPALTSLPLEQNLNIDSVLDVAWGEMKPSAMLKVAGDTGKTNDQLPDSVNSEPTADVTFVFSSSQASSYELDCGDGTILTGDMTPGTPAEVKHGYTATGKYEAVLSVFDADDVENSISRKIFIGDSDSPIAIITTKVDGSEVEPQDIETEDGKKFQNVIVVNRKSSLIFDAERSLNTDGTGRRLKYSWNINNNEKQGTTKTMSYRFPQISLDDKPYPVKVKVTNEKDATQSGEDTVNVLVVGEQPTVRSLTAVADTDTMTTPVTVKLSAVGAADEDGQIIQYKWWYYDANQSPSPDQRLGLQITTTPQAQITIGTRGVEGEKPKYKFGLEVTDNDNLIVSTDSQDENKKLSIPTPEIQVTNGPNKAPVARFTVNRTSVEVGEAVSFTSSSVDPDAGGGIKEYKWDFGDGSKGENRASVTHIYQKANVDGYKTRLTVVDNNSSEATSDVVKVFVDAQAQPPVAAFTFKQQAGSRAVQFSSNSTADEAAGASIKKYSWDFDVTTDANGDGKKDNDIESGEANPSHNYPAFGIFRAKLTVEDNQGQIRSITNFVNVKPEPVKTGTTTGGTTTTSGNSGDSNSGIKSAGANLFEAGSHIDISLLALSMGAYAIMMLMSHKKQKINSKK